MNSLKAVYQFIRFVEIGIERDRPVYSCRNIRHGTEIGRVEWYPGWGQFCYFPLPGCVYSVSCLDDIKHFIGQLKGETP